jgi:hypothetical protein
MSMLTHRVHVPDVRPVEQVEEIAVTSAAPAANGELAPHAQIEGCVARPSQIAGLEARTVAVRVAVGVQSAPTKML